MLREKGVPSGAARSLARSLDHEDQKIETFAGQLSSAVEVYVKSDGMVTDTSIDTLHSLAEIYPDQHLEEKTTCCFPWPISCFRMRTRKRWQSPYERSIRPQESLHGVQWKPSAPRSGLVLKAHAYGNKQTSHDSTVSTRRLRKRR